MLQFIIKGHIYYVNNWRSVRNLQDRITCDFRFLLCSRAPPQYLAWSLRWRLGRKSSGKPQSLFCLITSLPVFPSLSVPFPSLYWDTITRRSAHKICIQCKNCEKAGSLALTDKNVGSVVSICVCFSCKLIRTGFHLLLVSLFSFLFNLQSSQRRREELMVPQGQIFLPWPHEGFSYSSLWSGFCYNAWRTNLQI